MSNYSKRLLGISVGAIFYTIRDLYRIWFAFVDPIIRVSNLNELLIGVSLKINNDDKNIKDSKYYTFMNKKDLENCFQKVFC